MVAIGAVRFTLFYPNVDKLRRRTLLSYEARARRVADLALAGLREPTASSRRRLTRQLIRLNEAALIIDANLAPEAVVLHQRLFDIELALTNVVRFAESLAHRELAPGQRDTVARALAAVRDGNAPAARQAALELIEWLPGNAAGTDESPDDVVVVITHRFAASVDDLTEAMVVWTSMCELDDPSDAAEVFQPSAINAAGWLPGSADVSADAATRSGPKRIDRVRLPINVRSGLQMGIAVAGAVAAGVALSPRRFYWAVLAAFLAFIGTNFAMEQIRKALYRVVGTIVGIFLGGLLVHIVGHHTNWSIAIILLSLFFGVYLFRVSYAFMVVGITVGIAQVYVELGEFSNALLVLRLEETLIGAAVAILTILLVVPLGSRRVMGVALAVELRALTNLIGHTVDRLARPGASVGRHQDARQLDSAFQALFATAQPLRRSPIGDISEEIGGTVASAFAIRNYGRNLVADSEDTPDFDPALLDLIRKGQMTMDDSVAVLIAACDGDRSGTYVRSASLFDGVSRRLDGISPGDPRRLVIRDFQLLDGALARLASTWKVNLTSLDTGRLRVDQPAEQ